MEKSMILLSLFSNIETLLKTIIVVLLVIGMIWLCIRIPQLVPVVATILAVSIVAIGMFCAYDSYKYLSAKNMTIGEVLQSAFNNKAELDQDENNLLKWNMKNIGFSYEGASTYSTTIEKPHNEVIDLENNNYELYINNQKCYLNETGNDFVKSEYKCSFSDQDNNLILEDSLYINFGFYQNQTVIVITTKGGEQAVELWKSYQVKNGFIFELKATSKALSIKRYTKQVTHAEIVNNTNSQQFAINIYVDKKIDTNASVKYLEAYRVKYPSMTNVIKTDLVATYKSSDEFYNLYSGIFDIQNYKFLNIGQYINGLFPATEEMDGVYYLGFMSTYGIAEVDGCSLNLTEYTGINPTGKILNVYIDLIEVVN